MNEKFRKQMRDTFIKGNEVYAGQKPNGTIARILADHTWSEKYQKVVPRKGRYALLFQDPGGGGQVIAFALEQLEKALSDLKQQGYEQTDKKRPTDKHMKKHWQMTRQEFYVIGDVEEYRDKTFGQYGHNEKIFRDGVTRLQNAHKELLETGQAKHAVALWEAAKWRDASEKKHEATIKQALAAGKPVPAEVLRDYPDLIPIEIPPAPFGKGGERVIVETDKTLRKPQSKPLPPDAQNIQDLSFNSDQFTCYGKPTGRGFRAYCRRK